VKICVPVFFGTGIRGQKGAEVGAKKKVDG